MSQPSDGNLPKVLSVLELLTEEELSQLNHIVVQRLRLMRQIRSHGQMMQFRIGQRVSFITTGGRVVRGVIVRHNRTSVTIGTDEGDKWNVAPGLVRSE